MKTYTICPPHNGNQSKYNTFVMSFENQVEEHEVLDLTIEKELQQLRYGIRFCHGGFKKSVNVKVGILSTCVD